MSDWSQDEWELNRPPLTSEADREAMRWTMDHLEQLGPVSSVQLSLFNGGQRDGGRVPTVELTMIGKSFGHLSEIVELPGRVDLEHKVQDCRNKPEDEAAGFPYSTIRNPQSFMSFTQVLTVETVVEPGIDDPYGVPGTVRFRVKRVLNIHQKWSEDVMPAVPEGFDHATMNSWWYHFKNDRAVELAALANENKEDE